MNGCRSGITTASSIAASTPRATAAHHAAHVVALPRWQDLSTLDSEHGKGVGRALIEAVYDAARRHRAEYVHWLADACDGSHNAARPTTRARHERQDLQKDASALSTVDRVFDALSFNASTTRHVHPDRRGDMAVPTPGSPRDTNSSFHRVFVSPGTPFRCLSSSPIMGSD